MTRAEAVKEAEKFKSKSKSAEGSFNIKEIEFQGELGEVAEVTDEIAKEYGVNLSELNKSNLKLIEGVLMFTDEPCQPTKLGSKDDGIDTFIFDSEKIKESIGTIKNKPIHAKVTLDGHFDIDKSGEKRYTPIGVFLGSKIIDSEVRILGGLWEDDFPNLINEISTSKSDLGMSFEISVNEMLNVVEDSGIAVVGSHTHKGGCILWKDSAAFSDTCLLIAQKGGAKASNIGESIKDSTNTHLKGGNATLETFTQEQVDALVKQAVEKATTEFHTKLKEGELIGAKEKEITDLKAKLDLSATDNKKLKEDNEKQAKDIAGATAKSAATEWWNANGKFYPKDKKDVIIAARTAIELGDTTADQIDTLVNLKITSLVVGSGAGGEVDKDALAKRHGIKVKKTESS